MKAVHFPILYCCWPELCEVYWLSRKPLKNHIMLFKLLWTGKSITKKTISFLCWKSANLGLNGCIDHPKTLFGGYLLTIHQWLTLHVPRGFLGILNPLLLWVINQKIYGASPAFVCYDIITTVHLGKSVWRELFCCCELCSRRMNFH